ncbi:MAG: chemotaxis protein CheX [Gemmatimonadetes bacterium]|nr:chemotaxis protein CheX [Gemmatimonadota bacterium]
MTVTTDDISTITETVFQSVLEWEVRPSAADPGDIRPERSIAGSVQIHGAWEGAVTLSIPDGLARMAARKLFGIDPDEGSMADVHDALAELTNMICGNLKAVLPGPSTLSMPTVADGSSLVLRIPGSEVAHSAVFECHGHQVNVTVLRRIDVGHSND